MFSIRYLTHILANFSKPLASRSNPYVTGNQVGGSDVFTGRSEIFQVVENNLSHHIQNAIVLHGQRRIGKTSILEELDNKLPQKGYQSIYFDLMGKTQHSLDLILDELTHKIYHKLQLEKPSFEEKAFHIWLDELAKNSSSPLVLLFDEFDAIDTPQTQELQMTFFNYLHEKLLPINPKKLNFIFAIGRNIGDFQAALMLFRTMACYPVSLLKKEETEDLVRLSEKNNSLFWSGAAIKKIWELTHGHAYLAQLLCSLIWHQLWYENPTRIPYVTLRIIEKYLEENINIIFERGYSALEWLWNGLPPACKIDTAALAELNTQVIPHKALIKHLYNSGIGAVIIELETAPRYLKEWDIIEGDEQKGYYFRVELFRQWVKKSKPLKEILQTELHKIRVEAYEHYQHAQSSYQNQEFDSAIENLKKALLINYQFIDAHQLLARIWIEKGELIKAREILEKFYTCCPDIARSQLTEVLWKQGELLDNKNEQLKWCEQILDYDPEHVNAKRKRESILQWQAKRFEEEGEYEKAIEKFRASRTPQEANRVRRKMLLAKYSTHLALIGCLIIGLLCSHIFGDLPLPINNIKWWVWGMALGLFLGLLVIVVSPLKNTTRKKF